MDRTVVPLGRPKVIFVTCRLICPMGPGAGGSRVVKSESGRLLRQWWNEAGDYLWVVDFFRLRGFMAALRASIGLGGVLISFALVCLQFEDLVQPQALSHALLIGMTLASIS